MRHAIDMSTGEVLLLIDELQELAWASDYDDENNVLEFSQRCADDLDPGEFLTTVLKLLTDAGLAPNGCERRIYELFRKGQPIPNARYTSLDERGGSRQSAQGGHQDHLDRGF
jgi:hypothetical protein